MPEVANVASEELGRLQPHAAFAQARKELRSEFGEDEFSSWLAPMRLIGESGEALMFVTPRRVQAEWVHRHAAHKLESHLSRLIGRRVRAIVSSEADVPPDFLKDARAFPQARVVAEAEPAPAPQHTFASFAVGASNRAAFLVARDIAQGVGGAFPIVLLHGPPGVGKTHLMNAIAAEAAIATPGRRVRYMMAQIFTEEFLAGLSKRKDLAAFKASVRENCVFLLDDVHRIAGRKATEEEFLDTLQVILSLGGQVVVSADQGPEGLGGFDERLRNQLRGATECFIGEPDLELRRRIVDLRVDVYRRASPDFSPPEEVLDMIAQRLQVSGRELDGAVRQLLVAHRGDTPITLATAEDILRSKLCEPEKRPLVDQIIKATARHFNMEPKELLARTRQKSVARPRQIAMYLACTMTTRSLPEIGRRFGGFDHTTVLYAKRKVPSLLEKDSALRNEVEKLRRAIRDSL